MFAGSSSYVSAEDSIWASLIDPNFTGCLNNDFALRSCGTIFNGTISPDTHKPYRAVFKGNGGGGGGH